MKARKKTNFKLEQEKWYKKLKESGFKDIEHADGSLNVTNPRSFHFKDEDLRQSVQDYYCMAYHFLNAYKFISELDKVMWEYHTEGLSIRNIVKTLNKAGFDKVNRTSVWKCIRRLENTMKELYLST